MFEFTFYVIYFHRVSDIWCIRLYLVNQTPNILFSVVTDDPGDFEKWSIQL